MEFSYRLTYQVCLDAMRLRYWRSFRKVSVGIVVAAVLFEAYVLAGSLRVALAEGASLTESIGADSNPVLAMMLLALIAVAIFAVTYPGRCARRFYSTSPARDGLVHVWLTQDRVDVKAEAGASSSYAWNFYEKWCEGKRVFVLIAKGGQFQFLPKSTLTAEQLSELRTFLGSKLPGK
jgi:hypothetical protein